MASREATSCMLAVLLLAVGPRAATQTASQAPAINGLVSAYVSDHHVALAIEIGAVLLGDPLMGSLHRLHQTLEKV